MMFASILISGRDWLLPAIGFFAFATLLLLWTYHRAPADKRLRVSCAGLKLLGLAALAVCLVDPLWSGQRAKPGANYLAVLADNSQGMQIKDGGDNRLRGEMLRDLLDPKDNTWLSELDETFQLRRYLFDSRLQSTRDFSELNFDGRATFIGSALRTLGDRFQGQPLAGILLLTDGNATDLSAGLMELDGLPPVYPVVIGSDHPIRDIAISRMSVSQTVFEHAPVMIQADVSADGYRGSTVVAQVIDQTGRIIEEQSQRPARNGVTSTFHIQLRPERSGISFYQVRVSARDELGQFTRPELSTEATLANNRRVAVVDRGRGPYRILYVGGRPNWEFKYMNRALDEDDELEMASLIRIADREPKFEFRGRFGEASNPLFRGFDRQDEQTERYDEAVLIRLNTRDAAELIGGFPKTSEELFNFHAVIVDRLEAEFFTRDQMTLLYRFVSERGGGFLMMGGAESFHQGGYQRTPIGDMLPVYMDRLPDTPPGAKFRLSLTREGLLQPWARLRDSEAEEKNRLLEMPRFEVLNRARGVKPGASVIASVRDERGNEHPALVSQRFGHGRTVALLVGDLWRWGLREEAMRQDADRAWRQTIRWLIADVPERIELRVLPQPDDPNHAMLLQARARDKNFQPLDNASVHVVVRYVGDFSSNAAALESDGIRLPAEPSLTQAGVYETTYIPREAGGYLAEAVVRDSGGVEVGRAEAGWTSDPAAKEFRSLKPNRALLEAIARRTGGEVVERNRLDSFASNLASHPAPISEHWTYPLWHQPLVFLLALFCFAAEWGLRRWKGLA